MVMEPVEVEATLAVIYRVINPGKYTAGRDFCGQCIPSIHSQREKGMMAHILEDLHRNYSCPGKVQEFFNMNILKGIIVVRGSIGVFDTNRL